MSEKLFQKYKVEIEPLSPLFIGSGKEWYPNEYYRDLKNDIILLDNLLQAVQNAKLESKENHPSPNDGEPPTA